MNKILKKKQVQWQILQKLEDKTLEALISDTPTNSIVILNCSYDSLVSGDQLLQVFSPYHGFERIEMFLGRKPYSYAFFTDSESASVAYQELDGIKSPVLQKIVYLSYANYIPEFPSRPLRLSEQIETIPGLKYFPDFITPEEEASLLHDVIEQGNRGRWEILDKRSVQHYGFRFDYPSNDVDRFAIDIEKDEPAMPSWCEFLIERYQEFRPNQLTINRYYPGDGIAPHCDRHSSFGPVILILSLSSDIVMEFKSGKSQTACVLAARSLLVISGEARYGWEHVIRPRKVDLIEGLIKPRAERWSLTFRTVRPRNQACDCEFKNLCD